MPALATHSTRWHARPASISCFDRMARLTWADFRWKPPSSGDRDQLDQPDRGGVIAAVEGQLPGAPRAADQQPPAARAGSLGAGSVLRGSGQLEPGPVVEALSLRARPGREPLP